MPRVVCFVVALWLVAGAGSPVGSVEPSPPGLLAVQPGSPWTLRELQRLRIECVSYDPESGVTYVIATTEQQRLLHEHGFRFTTIAPDVDAGRRRLQQQPDLGLYHTHAEMVQELETLAASYPELCRLQIIGQSVEGRPIHALKISDDPQDEDDSEPDVLIVGNHHARELMSVEVPLHLAEHLLSQAARNRFIDDLVRNREIWIVPMLNPDGHVFQEGQQRYPGWRKNRRPNDDGTVGVDLNRNYGYLWGYDDVGSSPDAVSQTYRGPTVFSEPETQAIRDLTETHDFVIALSYHSFGELLLYPWGWTDRLTTPDHNVFVALADSMVLDNGYRPGNPYNGAIYLTNGDFDDWMYGERNARKSRQTFSFTVELNSEAQGGFWPDESLIQTTCDQLLSLNLYAIRVAQEDLRSILPPPPPVVSLHQDETDPRQLDLTWTLTNDPANPVDHYEVFEIDPVGASVPRTVSVQQAGHGVLVEALRVPSSGVLTLRLTTRLEPLWDFVYIEARPTGTTTWKALPSDRMQQHDPTGANSGFGVTQRLHDAVVRVDAAAWRGRHIDVAVRLVPHADSPLPARLTARLDLPNTLTETRRVVADNVRDTQYSFVVERSGIFAYGVTAIDMQGQRTDSEVTFVYIPPVTDVAVQDIVVESVQGDVVLRWRSTSSLPAQFVAWSRPLAVGEQPGSVQTEWQSGSYRRVAAATDRGTGTHQLRWRQSAPREVVLLQGHDAESSRFWGPWVVSTVWRTTLHRAVPNPFNPTTRLSWELQRSGPLSLDILSVDGRRLRRLVDGVRPAGSGSVLWDGRDDAGRPVASGVYLAMLRADGLRRVQRLVLLR